MAKPKLLVILGPTASGKSDLAIKLAQKFKGEIISADSRQVYRGMDIGTGKVLRNRPSPKNKYYSEGIRHHLLDVASPLIYFSLSQYQRLALKAIKEIWKRKKLPILCGGTGLYLSCLIEGWQLPNVPPNQKLRQKLEKLSTEKLFEKLKKIDPQAANQIDKKNKRRLIRALEIASQNGFVPPLLKKPPDWDILILGIKKEKQELKNLIKKRLEKRLKEGMVEEVKNLKAKGVPSQRLDDFGLEYRWLNRYLEGKISYPEMVQFLYRDIYHYAKRQMTWFRNKIKNIHWIENEKEAQALVLKWLKSAP